MLSKLEIMASSMKKRGPDGHGIWQKIDESIGLAHARLSIIDLSSAGNQPMTYKEHNKHLCITFNGEIYNYQELRDELQAEGVSFETNTDTEVILAGWAKLGTSFVKRLRGMYAFAIWDTQKRTLVLCRDRMGVKPLLWAQTEKGVVFASTLKAILDSGCVEARLELQGIYDLFATGSVCQPGTMIRGVFSLEPGTILCFNSEKEKRFYKYWNLADAVHSKQSELQGIPYEEAVILTRNHLEEACRYHLIADVQVGAFLSGGVDSTAVTALMSRQMSSPVKRFTVGFEEIAGYRNELKDAKIAAEYIGCDHTEVVVTGSDIEELYDDIVSAIDQPSYDGLNTYVVSKATSRNIKVALTGQGGDEIFAGYNHFSLLQNATKSAGYYERIFTYFNKVYSNRYTSPSAKLAAIRQLSLPERYSSLRRGMSYSNIRINLNEKLTADFEYGFMEKYLTPMINNSEDSVVQTSIIECHHYLLNTLLRDGDAMSMGHSLEVRPMMLDHYLVELAIALPANYKVRKGRNKAVFKDAIKDLIPPHLLKRPKTGFTLPIGLWMSNELRNRLQFVLESETAQLLFSKHFIGKCKINIDNKEYHRTLWTMMMLISWIDKYGISVR